jgi:aspartyl/asparaginyl-tRNA synthetase
MSTKYNVLLGENQDLVRKQREKDKMVQFMEKELERRTKEFKEMTNTFEEFLAGRAKQAKKERNEKLKQLADQQKVQKKDQPLSMNIVKAHVPDRVVKVTDTSNKAIAMLDRGYVYLKRFKNLSKAFETGDFRSIQNAEIRQDVPGPWTKVFCID